MESIFSDGVAELMKLGAIVTLLLLVIAALVWDRKRILDAHKEMTDKLILTIEKQGEKYAELIAEYTKAYNDLAAAIRERR